MNLLKQVAYRKQCDKGCSIFSLISLIRLHLCYRFIIEYEYFHSSSFAVINHNDNLSRVGNFPNACARWGFTIQKKHPTNLDALLFYFTCSWSTSFSNSIALSSLGSFVPSSPRKAFERMDCFKRSILFSRNRY